MENVSSLNVSEVDFFDFDDSSLLQLLDGEINFQPRIHYDNNPNRDPFRVYIGNTGLEVRWVLDRWYSDFIPEGRTWRSQNRLDVRSTVYRYVLGIDALLSSASEIHKSTSFITKPLFSIYGSTNRSMHYERLVLFKGIKEDIYTWDKIDNEFLQEERYSWQLNLVNFKSQLEIEDSNVQNSKYFKRLLEAREYFGINS